MRVNAAEPEHVDYYIWEMIGAYIEIFGNIDDNALKAIEIRVRDGCTYPMSDTPGDVLETLEKLGWPI